MRFYLVDDDPLMVKLQSRILMNAGHEVAWETDSTIAMDAIIGNKPDCVITDLMMPGVDGYQLITQIRKETSLDHTVVIVLSAKAFMQDKRQALDFGASGFIRKPVDPVTFLDKVREVIEKAMPGRGVEV
jgi:DNA-binding response OmpR family regulator